MRFGTSTTVRVAGESAEIICFSCSRVPPSLRAFILLDFAVSSKHTRKGMKFTLPNSLVHDTDEHNFYVRQPHCRRMEYVRKTLSRRHFNKLEAMQSRHHMKDPTIITLPSQMCLIISGTSTNQRQYMFQMICKMQPILHCQLEGVSSEVIDEGYTRKVV